MAIVYQTCKKTGIVYAYQNTAYWDKQKKQSRAIRKLIGKVDPETGEIVPTRPHKKKTQPIDSEVDKQATQLDSNMQDVTRFTRKFCGVKHLLQQIGNQLGITQDLKAIFQQDYKQIQSIAQYLLLEENNWHCVRIAA